MEYHSTRAPGRLLLKEAAPAFTPSLAIAGRLGEHPERTYQSDPVNQRGELNLCATVYLIGKALSNMRAAQSCTLNITCFLVSIQLKFELN